MASRTPHKCSLQLATAIVAAWQEHKYVSAIDYALFTWYVPKNMAVRAYLPMVNKLASNALWDGFPNKATNLLMKHGLAENESRSFSHEPEIAKAKRDFRIASFANKAFQEFKEASSHGPANSIRKRVR